MKLSIARHFILLSSTSLFAALLLVEPRLFSLHILLIRVVDVISGPGSSWLCSRVVFVVCGSGKYLLWAPQRSSVFPTRLCCSLPTMKGAENDGSVEELQREDSGSVFAAELVDGKKRRQRAFDRHGGVTFRL
jgi:hypothetical protein